jgi:hypothetical protein
MLNESLRDQVRKGGERPQGARGPESHDDFIHKPVDNEELTYHRAYSSGAMLGKDRRDTLEEILRSSFPPPTVPKELRPINHLVAAPRQGRSLMLDMVAAGL